MNSPATRASSSASVPGRRWPLTSAAARNRFTSAPKPAASAMTARRWAISSANGASRAHAKAYASLSLPEAKDITQLSGITEEPHQAKMCLGCHATAAEEEDWERGEGFPSRGRPSVRGLPRPRQRIRDAGDHEEPGQSHGQRPQDAARRTTACCAIARRARTTRC